MPLTTCAAASDGRACASTTALYAGIFGGKRLMSCRPVARIQHRIRAAQSGSVEIPILAAITSPTEGGVHAAAKYCDDMVYGGFSDWFLPSKSELAYLFCKSSPLAYNAIYPQENVNCGGSGPTNQLTGFAANRYWATTESSAADAYQMRFDVGNQTAAPKSESYYVRCVRSY